MMAAASTYGIEGASAFGSLATSPLVVNGTVYLQDLKSNVYAIDFRSGKLEWQKRYNADNCTATTISRRYPRGRP
jgi:outer membrane protein assembly factor BamB